MSYFADALNKFLTWAVVFTVPVYELTILLKANLANQKCMKKGLKIQHFVISLLTQSLLP
jgi:hypothetical protein